MKEDEFAKIFKYTEQRFSDIERALADKADKSDIGRVLDSLDAMSGTVSDAEVERYAHASQLSRHDEDIDRLDRRVSDLEARAA